MYTPRLVSPIAPSLAIRLLNAAAGLLATTTPRGYNEEDELIDHLSQNSGKSMTPFEQATVFKKLGEKGYSQVEIAN